MSKGQDCGGLRGEPAGAGAVPPEVAWLEQAFLLSAGKAKARCFPRHLLASRLPKADATLPPAVNASAHTQAHN